MARPSGSDMRGWLLRSEVGMAVGVIGVILLLILPIPKFLMDLLLAISLVSSVLILMTALMMKRPLDFAIFPTVLLVSTLFRLGLNLASTRLVLSHGHEGHDAAGQVIAAFGSLMMGGSFIIGVIIFAIILVVNFVVITKGSTRIAEVSARFTLDSMPGKQMAIDADLSSGLIDRGSGQASPQGAGAGIDLLRGHGRCLQVRARRRRRRPGDRLHQRDRRHPDRDAPARDAASAMRPTPTSS
jgi:flagellar biosynthesis protein FlhA